MSTIPTPVLNALNQVQTDADSLTNANTALANAQQALAAAQAAVPAEQQAVATAQSQLNTDYQALLAALAAAYGQPAPSPTPSLSGRR